MLDGDVERFPRFTADHIGAVLDFKPAIRLLFELDAYVLVVASDIDGPNIISIFGIRSRQPFRAGVCAVTIEVEVRRTFRVFDGSEQRNLILSKRLAVRGANP